MARMNNSPAHGPDHPLPPSSPIQRILIAHFGLYERCMDGEQLGENASIEELGEEILYFHQDRRVGTSSTTIGEDDDDWNLTSGSGNGNGGGGGSQLEEAVSFLGLCKALYTLPMSLKIPHQSDDDHKGDNDKGDSEEGSDDDGEDKDNTTSVYFGNSVLVFIPLESNSGVVAIVQVSRLYQNGSKSNAGSANPLAVSVSIERSHRLFCMLRGGGIDLRLKAVPSSSTTTTTTATTTTTETQERDCPYLGMKRLFVCLKSIRRNRTKLSRFRDPSTLDRDVEETNQHIGELQKEIEALRKWLPIRSLRLDLESHYNEYLSHFLEVCIRNGGAGRCLVEMIPAPIAQVSGSHTFQSQSCSMEPGTLESLRQSTLRILKDHSRSSLDRNNASNTSLLGIAIYKSGQLLCSLSDCETHDLSNDTVGLLMAHMASYRTKMSHAPSSANASFSSSSSSLPELQPGFLKRLARHLTPMVDEPPSRTTAAPGEPGDAKRGDKKARKDMFCRGRFVSSPPSFMLDASDKTYSLDFGSIEHDIWAPRVHLPLANSASDKENHGDAIPRDDDSSPHMVLFEFRGFSFLIFLDIPVDPSAPNKLSSTKLLLMELEEKLSETVIRIVPQNSPVRHRSESWSTECGSEAGQSIIFLERATQKMVLLLDPKLPSARDSKKGTSNGTKNRNEGRRFMGLGPAKRVNEPLPQRTGHRSTTLEWSAWGLDCRHLLASRLPLDVCLAFDDMINEVTRQKDSRQESSSSDASDNGRSSSIELCTCMRYGWIFAFATEETEIYVFFDSSIYVTVADVQSAVVRIKERFIVTK